MRTLRPRSRFAGPVEPPPAWIKPQLSKLVKQAPDGPDWLHELNNPLTVIAGWASMLSPTTDAARYTRAIEAIDLGTKRLMELLGRPPV